MHKYLRFIDKFGYGEPFVFIHPYKQTLAKAVLDKAFEYIKGIEHIIIFGSAITDACKPYSDIDICVIGDFDISQISKLRVKDEAMDILHFKNVATLKEDPRLFEEISKGVAIYA